MMNNSDRSNRLTRANTYLPWFLLAFVAFFILGYLSPLSVDDYYFLGLKKDTFADIFSFCLTFGNGRVLGNFGVIYLVKSHMVRSVVKALMVSLSAFLIPYLVNAKKKSSYAISFLLFVWMAPPIFAQTFVWTSGFQNYFPPIFLTLVLLATIKIYPRLHRTVLRFFAFLTVAVLGIASQLFVEHSTVINVLLALTLFFVSLKQKRNVTICLTYLCSVFTGGALMLLIPMVYKPMDTSVSSYRSLPSGGILSILKSTIQNAADIGNILSQNIILFIILFITCAVLIWKIKDSLSRRVTLLLFSGLFFPASYFVINYIIAYGRWIGAFETLRIIINLPLSAIFLVTVFFVIKKSLPELSTFAFALLCGAFASLAPLTIVRPIGGRLILQGYVFLIALAIAVCEKCDFSLILDSRLLKYGTATMIAICLIVSTCLIVVLGNIYFTDKKLTNFFDFEVSQGVSEIEYFVNSEYPYFHTASSSWAYGRYWYNQTYGDIQFKEIPYLTWIEKYDK